MVECPGCGKNLRDEREVIKHSRRCEKLWEINIVYYLPSVEIGHITHLELRPLVAMGSNEPEWGIWNKATGDWVRNKVGQIDSRIFQCNIKSLLDNVVAKALVDNAVK